MSDSTVPMAASTVQGSPGQVAAASSYRASMAGGICVVAVALGALSPPPRREATPAPAPAARSSHERTRPAAPAANLVPRLAVSAVPMLTIAVRTDVVSLQDSARVAKVDQPASRTAVVRY